MLQASRSHCCHNRSRVVATAGGNDDPGIVIPMAGAGDGRGRVHGVERVVVADCSLMPTVARANTNVPAVLVGERIADTLLEG